MAVISPPPDITDILSVYLLKRIGYLSKGGGINIQYPRIPRLFLTNFERKFTIGRGILAILAVI